MQTFQDSVGVRKEEVAEKHSSYISNRYANATRRGLGSRSVRLFGIALLLVQRAAGAVVRSDAGAASATAFGAVAGLPD